MNQKESILIVDDDESTCRSLRLIFGKKGYETEIAGTAQEALEKIKKRSFNVTLIDIRLPDMEGTVLLGKLKKVHPEMVCIVITGYASIENTIMAIKLGSNGYFVKPLVMEEVIYRLEEALDKQRLEGKLKESEQKYRTLYESSKDGITFSDMEGNLLDANQAFLDMLGYRIEEIKRLTYQKITPKKWHEVDADIVKNQIMTRGYSKEFEKEFIKKDGTVFPIAIIAWLLKDKQGKPVGLWGIIRDITQRKKAEERIEHLNLVLRAIRKVNQLIVRENDRNRLLKGACKNLIETRGYYNTWIALLDEEGKLKACAEAGLGKDFLPMIELLKRGKLTTCGQKALKQQEVVIIDDPVSTCTDCPLAQKCSGRGGMSIRLEHSGKVYGLMTVSISAHFAIDQEEQSLLKEVAGDIALGLHNIELEEVRKQQKRKLQQSYQKLQKTMEEIINTIGNIVETRDPYTAGHQKDVSQIATFMAQEMKLPKDKIEGIRIASLVHDVGKISLPAEILNKPTKLTEIEYNLIKDHSQTGHDILKSIEFPWPIAQIVLQHHERLNGSGYPEGLKGEDILLEAKIIGIVDVVEAMSSHRPYRPALGIDKALEEISKNEGTLYDPEVVDMCLKLFKEKRI